MLQPRHPTEPVTTTTITRATVSGTVYCGDAIDMLNDIGPECADVLFLDPPFNLGKRYSTNSALDNKPDDEYMTWLTTVIDLAIQVLRPGAALFLYHLPLWALRLGSYVEKSLDFRHWITVSMKNGFARGQKLYPAHYALLYFTKGAPQYFFRPKLQPLRCRSCGTLVRDYGGYRKLIEEKGVNLSDIWDDLSPVRHKNRKYRIANELPVALFDRVITISGKPGMTYVDPFAGSGSGAVAAFDNCLNFLVGDVISENTRIIIDRLCKPGEDCG